MKPSFHTVLLVVEDKFSGTRKRGQYPVVTPEDVRLSLGADKEHLPLISSLMEQITEWPTWRSKYTSVLETPEGQEHAVLKYLTLSHGKVGTFFHHTLKQEALRTGRFARFKTDHYITLLFMRSQRKRNERIVSSNEILDDIVERTRLR